MKPKRLILFSILYFILLAFELYAEYHFFTHKDFRYLRIFQPVLVPALISYLVFNTKIVVFNFPFWILLGLIFDWLADLILTFYQDAFNIPSMLGYFLGLICFATGFVKSIGKNGYNATFLNRFIFSLPPLFYLVVYYFFVQHYMSHNSAQYMYILPAAFYSIAILAMSSTALWRIGSATDSSYWMIVAGGFFYLVSDSITGYDHFVEPVKLRYLLTMSSYGIALYFIMLGTILHRPHLLQTMSKKRQV